MDKPESVAALIDHTLLKPDATEIQIQELIEEALRFHFASVCINPYWVRLASRSLAASSVKLCTVIGFPLGANETGTKAYEARRALDAGATELDMVINLGALRSGAAVEVQREVSLLADLAHASNAILKVILETCLLSEDEKRTACRLCVEAHADFVKTSTGFSAGGATIADVKLMRQAVGDRLGVKASGGIRSLTVLREMASAGATRIGTSSGVAILRELESPGSSSPTVTAGRTY